MVFIVTVIGVILVIEGIPYTVFPAKAKKWALMIEELPESTLRVVGVASIFGGLILLFITKYFLR
ncbi:MAG: DUF2065 domain-containing protein [Deltaproteobacteria bacterium]|nr:DUF2065 domain-containing protein [Deltaproteobacteria bacterium]